MLMRTGEFKEVEGLLSKTVPELRDIAKIYSVTGRWKMTKTQLIHEILEAQKATKEENDAKVTKVIETKAQQQKKDAHESNKCNDEYDDYKSAVNEITAKGMEIHKAMKDKTTSNNETKKRDSNDYLSNKEKGLIVAIEHEGRFYSAKITDYIDDDKVEVETKHMSKFTINKSQVKWVKTGARWPKFVFEKFKERVEA